ncbi:hypothetical protein [Vibrio sp. 10N.286.48.B7]
MCVWQKRLVMASQQCTTTNIPQVAKAYLALAGEMLRREEVPV